MKVNNLTLILNYIKQKKLFHLSLSRFQCYKKVSYTIIGTGLTNLMVLFFCNKNATTREVSKINIQTVSSVVRVNLLFGVIKELIGYLMYV